jgi:hypothetical protein
MLDQRKEVVTVTVIEGGKERVRVTGGDRQSG